MESSRKRKSIIIGTDMVCPRCKRIQSILSYTKLQEKEEYQHETVPIYKCPKCSWHFALGGELLTEHLYKLMLDGHADREAIAVS